MVFQTMRAIDVKPGGTPSGLFINPHLQRPVPSAEECLVRVKAFGLNRGDTLQREGLYPPPHGITSIMGLEFAGIIEEVGSSENGEKTTEKWSKGNEVFGLLYGGGYAEFVVAHKRMLIQKPKELSWATCGGLCEAWFTALQALHLIAAYDSNRVKSILWHAGASSVSIAGIQLSRAAQGHGHPERAPSVFATTRSDEKREMCVKKLGCTGALNIKETPNWAAEVKKLNCGGGIDIVFDFVGGGSYFQSNLDVLALDGALVNLGLLGGPVVPGPVDISPIIMKRCKIVGSTLRTRSLEYQIRLRDLFVERVLPGLVNSQFVHVVDQVLEWEDITKAHRMLENNETKGKIVCSID